MASGLFALIEALDARIKALEAAPAGGVSKADLDATNAAVDQVTRTVTQVASDLAAEQTVVGAP